MTIEYGNSDLLRVFDPEEGMPVAALYKDGTYYRAEIVKIHSDKLMIEVMFVDYGETCLLSYDKVRYLKKDFLYDEVSTFRCKLFGIEYKDEQSYQEVK